MKTVDIVERIEGEAKLVCSWKDGLIDDSRIEFLNFRGFEYILEGKSPLDALVYTPRICGICGQAHLHTTVNALENIYENIGEPLLITKKAKLLREIGLNIEIIDSHIKWFYMFIMPDIVELSKKKFQGYEPLKGNKWLEASAAASETIKALAIIGGQWPHTSYMIPGGVVSDPTLLDLVTMQNYLENATSFFEKKVAGVSIDKYLNFTKVKELELLGSDLKEFIDISFEIGLDECGRSYDRHISLGKSTFFESGKNNKRLSHKLDFSKIKESEEFSFDAKFSKSSKKSYSWSKSVKYDNSFYETGPLSRALIQNRRFLKDIHRSYKDSAFTRIMARVGELAHLLNVTQELIKQIDVNEDSFIKPKIALSEIQSAKGSAAVEACRGSLFHELSIKDGKIASYNVITPTVWNLGPGDKHNYSVAQKAIKGCDSIEKAKIVLRSFDVCSVCTTH